jgi:ribosomal protein S18 acetylase RimI-like enzyme
MSPADLAPIAHRGLLLRPPPLMRHQPGARHTVRDGLAMFAWGQPGPSFNKVAVLGPAPPLARILELADDFFGKPGGYGVLVQADAGHPVEAELIARGWRVVEDEEALVLPAIPSPPPLPPGLEVRRVSDDAGRRDFLAVAAAGFGASTSEGLPPPTQEQMDSFGPTLACALDPDVAVVVGYLSGRPVSAAIVYRLEEIAGITGVATVPDQRRRGLARALTWAALAEGAARGCRCGTLNASGASFHLYRSMGFVHVCNHRTYAAPEKQG